jgi:hypothetical protein
MRNLVTYLRLVAAASVVALALGASASADTAAPVPLRHLVYDFTYSNSQTQTAHESGISNGDAAPTKGMGGPGSLAAAAPASGSAQSTAATSDRGQIVADVMRVQPDGGLIISVSEQANDKRSALPATCVVYGNTNMVCDTSKQINTEELALLRTLGSNFVDLAQIDAKNHWRVDQSGGTSSDVADYSIASSNGNVMKISSLRVLKEQGVQGFTATTNGTITYDAVRLVPTNLVEDEILRQGGGMGSYTEVRTQTSLALVADSAASIR